MNAMLFDTQEIQQDLIEQLRKAREDYTRAPSIDLLHMISWLQKKIQYVGSPAYYDRKRKAQS